MSQVRVLMGIDQAASSGWCITLDGAPMASGVATTEPQRALAAGLAQRYIQTSHPGLLLAVLEAHNYGQPRVTKALATAKGRWLEQLEGLYVPLAIAELAPSKWRAVLDCPRKGNEAKDWCKDRYKVSNSDRAEACGIAEAAWLLLERGELTYRHTTRAGDVGAKLTIPS